MCEINEGSFICESEVKLDSEEEFPKKCVPTQTQIREQLGSKLSDVFFEFLGSEAKNYLGLEPPLVGPDTVWISPESRLKNKPTVTPLPEPSGLHLKALTHGYITELGQNYIDLLENKYRLETENALKRQAEELKEEYEKSEKLHVSDSTRLYSDQKKIVGTLIEHFDVCFDDLVKTTQLRMRKECQLKVKEERKEVASYMLTQLQEEVERRDFELCNEFHDILYNELNILASRYIKQINNEREIAVQIIRDTVRNYEKLIQDLKTEMELNNTVDVCRAITQERLQCSERVRQIESEKRSKKNDAASYIEYLETKNCTLQQMSTERLKRLMQWRKKVKELLQEFQKFINFALQSVPGQSEFLLNMDKLMLQKFPEDSFLCPEDYKHFKDCLKGKLPDESLESLEAEKPYRKTPETLKKEKEPTEVTTKSEVSQEEKIQSSCEELEYREVENVELTFDYDQFKKMLVQRYARKLVDSKTGRNKVRKKICKKKKKLVDEQVDKTNEFYQSMVLAGEHEKEHLDPVDCFLSKRLEAIQEICRDDPEFATVILGCAD